MIYEKTSAIPWNSSKSHSQLESDYFKTQEGIVYHYLQSHVATASMVEEFTGVKQKCVTRIKAKLEKKGVLWEVKQMPCKITGCKAWYLTTNPELNLDCIQFDLFEVV